MPDARILAGAATLFGVGAAGLGVPAPVPRPSHSALPPQGPIDADLPDLLHRWALTAYDATAPLADTAEILGTGRVRLGRSPWLPVSYRSTHRIGTEFAAQMWATWFGRPTMSGLAGFVDNRGVMRSRESISTGPGQDSSALSYLWSEAFLLPASWSLDGVKWTQDDERTLQLEAANPTPGSAALRATIHCDPETGLPSSFRVAWRARNASGSTGAGWRVSYSDWREAEGGWAPGLVAMQWADEPKPWLRLRLEAPRFGIDPTAPLDEARRALESAD